jgi:small subunit ribosomal protein S19
MSRSLKKGPYVHPKVLIKVAKYKAAGSTEAIKTWSRSSTIMPDFVGVKFAIHNGKTFPEILVTEEMVGHKLGEFAFTTQFKKHGGKNAK